MSSDAKCAGPHVVTGPAPKRVYYIPAGCVVRNMAKQNVKKNAEMAGEMPTGASPARFDRYEHAD